MFKKPQNEPTNTVNKDTIDVSTTAVQIIAANRKRMSLLIQNQGTTALHLGFDDSITTSECAIVLQAANAARDGSGGSWNAGGDKEVYEGPVYGIRKSGTGVATYAETVDLN